MAEQNQESSKPLPNLPTSRPLQVFLLFALLVTGAAYMVDQWTDLTREELSVRQPNKFRRLLAARNQFETETALGRVAEAKKQYADAVTHFRMAMAAEVNPPGLINLGHALLQSGNPDMAFSQFQQALRMDPNQEPVYLAWGNALVREGKLDDAIQLYQDGLRRNPRFAGIHYNYAKALEQKQLAALNAQHDADLTQDTNSAARSAAEAKLFGNDAAKHFTAAVRLGLNDPDFLGDYGALLNKEGKFAEAETNLARALMLQTNAALQFQLGLAEAHLGKYGEAIAHYEAALAAQPDDPVALNSLALLYATATNAEVRSSKMAIQVATRACDATNDQNAHYMDTLARAYAADADFFQAIAWEDKAVQRAKQLNDRNLLQDLEPRFNLFVQHKTE